MENSTQPNNTTIRDTSESTEVGFMCYYYGIFLVLTLVNFSGNSLILTSIRHRNLRTPGNYFIFSLAASDLLHGIVYTVYNISHMELAGVRIFICKYILCSYNFQKTFKKCTYKTIYDVCTKLVHISS